MSTRGRQTTGMTVIVVSYLLLCVSLAFVATGAVAQVPQTRGIAVVPDQEKRSRIVNVVGEAPIPPHQRGVENVSITDALRGAALEAGQRQALDQVRTDIASSSDLEVNSDRGLQDVIIIEQHDLQTGPDAFRVSLRVEVRVYPRTILVNNPNQPATGGETTRPATIQDEPLTVSIHTDRKDYTVGDEMVLTIKGNKEFYGIVTYEDAAGAIIQVLPNAFRRNAKFEAGREYQIPEQGDSFRLKVTPPYGTERFTVYASTAPLGDVPASAANPVVGPSSVPDQRKEVERRLTRGIYVAPAAGSNPTQGNAAAGASSEFYQGVWAVNTQARSPNPSGAVPNPTNTPSPVTYDGYDSRLPRECTTSLARALIREINSMKRVRRSDFEVVDLRSFTTLSVNQQGLTCNAVMVSNDGGKQRARIRLFISAVGELLLEVRPI
jgi:hypothetical protein